MEFMYDYARKFPILLPTSEHEREMIEFVNKMLSSNKNKDEIDNDINKLVYKIYKLTPKEIKIVDESLK